MLYTTKIKWSFIASILAAVCWIIGDMFVAGFDVDPGEYPLFSKTYAEQVDVGIAVLMLKGSSERLMFGALIASMTATLFLPGVWLAYQYFNDKSRWYAWGTYFVLIVSVMLMPLGHADFYYTGEIYKAIYHSDPVAHPYLLETASGFTKVLYIAWGTAIVVLMVGWLLFSILVFMRKTQLPRWAAFISPVFITIYQLPLRFLPSSVLKGWLLAAGFNIAYLIFFILLWLLFKKPAAQETLMDS